MLQFLLPALLGAVGTIGSTLIGNSMQQSEDRRAEAAGFQRDDTKIQRLAADARAAGISPLAALGSPAAGSMAMPVVGQSGSRVAEGGARAFSQLAADLAAIKTDEDLAFQRAQTENLRASTAAMLAEARSRTIGQAVVAGSRGGAVPASTKLVLPSPAGEFPTWLTTPTSTAQTVQDEYGDIVENAYGVWRLASDAYRQLQRDTDARRGRWQAVPRPM